MREFLSVRTFLISQFKIHLKIEIIITKIQPSDFNLVKLQ